MLPIFWLRLVYAEEQDKSATLHTSLINGVYYNVELAKHQQAFIKSVPLVYQGNRQKIPSHIIIPGSFKENAIKYLITSIEDEAFRGLSVKHITITSCVLAIGKHAFQGCKSLQRFDIANDISQHTPQIKRLKIRVTDLAIAEGAFAYCSALTHVDFSKRAIKKLPTRCFAYCDSLTDISSILGAVADVGDECFIGSKLDSIRFPSSIRKLGEGVFRDSQNLVSANFAKSNIREISAYMFYNCTKFTTLSVNTKQLKFGAYAFSRTHFLSLTFPKSVKELGEGCWESCDFIRQIDLKSTRIDRVPPRLFANCRHLSEISLPESIVYINNSAFESTLIQNLNLPSMIEGIGDKAFLNCLRLESIYSQGMKLKYIGSSAFQNCTRLKKAHFFSQLETIGDYAFSRTGIQQYTSDPETSYIGAGAFMGCRNLQAVSLQFSSVKRLRHHCFSYCPRLFHIQLGTDIERIGRSCFECSSLRGCGLPKKLQRIGAQCFFNCTMLDSINLQQTQVATIPSELFSYSTIRSVKMPHTVRVVQKRAFANSDIDVFNWDFNCSIIPDECFLNCTDLKIFRLKNFGITVIGDSAFKGCWKLGRANFGSDLVSIGSEAMIHTGVREIRFSYGFERFGRRSLAFCNVSFLDLSKSKVTILPEGLFMGSPHLYDVLLPPRLVEIERFAFSLNPIQTLEFPRSLSILHEAAIFMCPLISRVDLKSANITEFTVTPFIRLPSLKELFLPTILNRTVAPTIECPVSIIYYAGIAMLENPKVYNSSVKGIVTRINRFSSLLGATPSAVSSMPSINAIGLFAKSLVFYNVTEEMIEDMNIQSENITVVDFSEDLLYKEEKKQNRRMTPTPTPVDMQKIYKQMDEEDRRIYIVVIGVFLFIAIAIFYIGFDSTPEEQKKAHID